jgi:hypothetical protein
MYIRWDTFCDAAEADHGFAVELCAVQDGSSVNSLNVRALLLRDEPQMCGSNSRHLTLVHLLPVDTTTRYDLRSLPCGGVHAYLSLVRLMER